MSDDQEIPFSMDRIRKVEAAVVRHNFLKGHFKDAANEHWSELQRVCNEDDSEENASRYSPSKEAYIADAAHAYVSAVDDASLVTALDDAWQEMEEIIQSTHVGRVLRLCHDVMRIQNDIERRDMMKGLIPE